MNRYHVDVVASYPKDVHPSGLLAALPQKSPGIPDLETTAVNWVIEESVLIPPLRQTMTVTYEVEGRDVDEAGQFALAIFAAESQRAGLPDPETVVANLAE